MKNRIALNSFFNVSAHFVRMAISIFMTPYLLSHLGQEVYGILPIVNSLVAFLVLASGGIQSAVSRYATLNISKDLGAVANAYINTAFWVLVGIFSLVLIPFVVGVTFLPHILTLPVGHEVQAQWVFLILGLNILVSVAFSPFAVGIYARQRFEFSNLISIGGQLLFVGFVLVCFHFFGASIILVALGIFINTLVSSLASMAVSLRLVPTLEFSISHFDRSLLKDIISYGFWTLIIQASVLIFLNTDYLIINQCIGPTAVTHYSLASRFNEMSRAVITAAVTVVTPACTQLEARGDFETLRGIFIRGVRLVVLMVIPPAVLLSVFSLPLLTVWVGGVYGTVAPLFWIILLPQVFILAAMPCNSILVGLGRVKWVGIANGVGALANILLSLTFVLVYDWGAWGVALATSLVLAVKNF
ncbi:MAG: oligosaccharide flippase family protein, partial [Desulfovibrionales bacterium]|nr:oligosaccharide flippase family protein [Desulfovibrionales bacterium]